MPRGGRARLRTFFKNLHFPIHTRASVLDEKFIFVQRNFGSLVEEPALSQIHL